ncbi:alcohol dehydrogenase catalytic domain-containing protein [Actinoplanes sp. NPDC051859]|uniref:alcohol dehydrogenase catalytic domain-containing protein n=1 Tax=Actinoplanes sp. NPDC051859 TaxID=3363909 RepID=UPI00378AB820
MTQTMRAFRMIDWSKPPQAETVPVPAPGAGQVLVRVAGCGLCRSDLTMARMPQGPGEKLGWAMPFTLGHETAGWVAARGPGVRDVSEGDPVALAAATSCGTCWHCVRGLDNSCVLGLAGRGYGRDGGLADYVLADRRALLPLGSLHPRHAGPLTDAGATAYHAVRRALPRIMSGGTVVVLGAGGLGAFALQFLRQLTAARIVAVDPAPDRLALAESYGTVPLPGVDDQTRRSLRQLVGGFGADAVLDFVGTDETIATGLAAVRAGGAYGLIGSAGGRLATPWFSTLPRDGEVFTFQGGSIADAQEVIALAQAGLIENIVEEFTFDQTEKAYKKLTNGRLSGRAVVLLTSELDHPLPNADSSRVQS